MHKGSLIELTEDFSATLQIAMFEMDREQTQECENFISNFRVKKNKIWKIGTNLRFMINSVLKPVKIDSLKNGCVMLGKSYVISDSSRFLQDYERIFWVTYREDFRSLQEDKLINSDMGWGCTIRVGQMMLLECLKRCIQVPEWQLLWQIQENLEKAPYSLHKIVKLGENFNKFAGDWYSPSNIACIISLLIDQHDSSILKTYLSMNCTIYEDQLYSKCCGLSLDQFRNTCKCIIEDYLDLGDHCAYCKKELIQCSWTSPIFIQIPIMLGIKTLLPEYIDTLKFILDSEFCVGIIGGKPRMALFIVGYCQDSFIVLDPHYVQKAPNSVFEFKERMKSYHCSEPVHIKFTETEGSFCLGFVVKNENEWKSLKTVLLDWRIRGVVSVQDQEPNICLNSSGTPSLDSSFLLL